LTCPVPPVTIGRDGTAPHPRCEGLSWRPGIDATRTGMTHT